MFTSARIEKFGITKTQLDLFEKYAECILSKKNVLNVTSAETKREIYDRHFLDALELSAQVKNTIGQKSFTLIDAGAGGGYIGICLHFLLSPKNTVLIDSVQKKCSFMTWVISLLELKNVTARAMYLKPEGNDLKADVVVQRAMGQLSNILPTCLDLVNDKGGYFFAYQSAKPQRNIEDMAKSLNATISNVHQYVLAKDNRERFLLTFYKRH
jgi:16S rRNA (guanine527-N7)-methyltransferase